MDRVPNTHTTEVVNGVHLASLAGTNHMNVQHFKIEPGATVPAHSHDNDQVGYLYQGELVFTVDGTEQIIAAGDSYAIPGGEVHAAENRGVEPALGIDVFSPPRSNPDW